jgi:hypothetical protein
MKIIVFTILFVFIGTTTMAQHYNFYAMLKKAPSFTLIDTSNSFLLKKPKNNKDFFTGVPYNNGFSKMHYYNKNNMPCKKDFVNVTAIPNACKNGIKIYAAPIPNASNVLRIKQY